MELMQTEETKALAADKAGMDEKTARKYVRLGKMPSEMLPIHTWRTREDPFTEVWEELRDMLADGTDPVAVFLLAHDQDKDVFGVFEDFGRGLAFGMAEDSVAVVEVAVQIHVAEGDEAVEPGVGHRLHDLA